MQNFTLHFFNLDAINYSLVPLIQFTCILFIATPIVLFTSKKGENKRIKSILVVYAGSVPGKMY